MPSFRGEEAVKKKHAISAPTGGATTNPDLTARVRVRARRRARAKVKAKATVRARVKVMAKAKASFKPATTTRPRGTIGEVARRQSPRGGSKTIAKKILARKTRAGSAAAASIRVRSALGIDHHSRKAA